MKQKYYQIATITLISEVFPQQEHVHFNVEKYYEQSEFLTYEQFYTAACKCYKTKKIVDVPTYVQSA